MLLLKIAIELFILCREVCLLQWTKLLGSLQLLNRKSIRNLWLSTYYVSDFWATNYHMLGLGQISIPEPGISSGQLALARMLGLRLVYLAPELDRLSLRTILSKVPGQKMPIELSMRIHEAGLVHDTVPGWYFVAVEPIYNDGEVTEQYRELVRIYSGLENAEIAENRMLMSLPLYLVFCYAHIFTEGFIPDDGLSIGLPGSGLVDEGAEEQASLLTVSVDAGRETMQVSAVKVDPENQAEVLQHNVRFCILADSLLLEA